MGTEVLAIIAGIVLINNEQWFNGAHTVGVIALVYGIVLAVIEILMFFGVIGSFLRR